MLPCMHIPHILCAHESVDGCLGCCRVLNIRNNSATNISVQVFVWACDFLGCLPRSRIAGFCVDSMFNLLGSWQTVFLPEQRTISLSHLQCKRVAVPPLPPQHLPAFWMMVGVKWSLFVILICISLAANDVDFPGF